MAAPISMKDVDPAFQGMGHKAGMEIWRIEQMRVVSLPKQEYGKFHTGDSYIILKTTAIKPSGFSYALHFWLGKETSQDEAGVAAIKTVELDAALGGKAVQYREAQGHESDLFLSYFRPCVIALPGGVTSGFKHVEPGKYETRLFQCKGKRFIRVRQVPFARTSLSHADIFILDTADKIFQFNGANASKAEKGKAMEVTQSIKDDDHHGSCQVAIIEDGKLDDGDSGDFWALFGGFAPIAKKGSSEDDVEGKLTPATLFSVDNNGVNQVASGGLQKSQLESAKCYLVDCGSEIYVWIGKISSLDTRKAASAAAEELLKKEKRPASTKIIRMPERYETATFKSNFDKWPVGPTMVATDSSSSKLKAMLRQSGVVDTVAMVKGSAGAGEPSAAPPFDPSGKVEVWRVEGSDKTPVPADEIGRFYTGDAYIIQYSIIRDRRPEHLYFFWLGRYATTEEKGAAAILATKMHNTARSSSLLARVVEGKEPEQFLALFKGHLFFFKGGRSKGYQEAVDKGSVVDETYSPDSVALLKVRVASEDKFRASQVAPVAGSLNSYDCFVLHTPSAVFLWVGNASSAGDKAAAAAAAELLKPGISPKIVVEGKETSTFWMHLGGKGPYASQREGKSTGGNPRLFACSNVTGALKVAEVYNFTQEDLLSEDVMILDTSSEIFVWAGAHANEQEKKASFDVAQKYLDTAVATEGYSKDTPLIKVIDGSEPPMFTAHFVWDATKSAVFVDPYERKLAQLQGRVPQGIDGARRKFGTVGSSSVSAPTSSSFSAPAATVVSGAPPQPFGNITQSASTQRAAAMAALSSALGPALGSSPQTKPPPLGTTTPAPADAPTSPMTPATAPAPIPAPQAEAGTGEDSASTQRAEALKRLSGMLDGERIVLKGGAGKSPTPAAPPAAPVPEVEAAPPAPDATLSPEPVAEPEPEPPTAPATAEVATDSSYPYARLISNSSDPAPGIDTTKRETYLSAAEFQKVMGMSMDEFAALPKWKKDQKKRNVDLF